jgi:hypothetical protein
MKTLITFVAILFFVLLNGAIGQVYEGTIGSSKITVCFGDHEVTENEGVYYYDRYKEFLWLSRERSSKTWIEKTERFADKATGKWVLNEILNHRRPQAHLTGEWIGTTGSRVLPIRLTLALDQKHDEYGSCGSNAFHLKLEQPPALERSAQKSFKGGPPRPVNSADKFQYQVLNLTLKKDGYSATTVILNPGDKRYEKINEVLKEYVTSEGLQKRHFDCRRSAISNLGSEGTYLLYASPSFWTNDWVDIIINTQNFCGGAHPNSWVEHRIWSLSDNAEVDLAEWFRSSGNKTQISSENLIWPEPKLFKIIEASFYKQNPDDDCKENFKDMQKLFSLSLTTGGMEFDSVGFCHACRSCSFSTVIPYKGLEPYLNEIGKERVASIVRSIERLYPRNKLAPLKN